jgi:glycosyltransferase involved in cell wall biosynthesis
MSYFPDEVPNEVPHDVEVSVCLITYNHAPYIAQAIESILMQKTSFKFEICIGEDDSSDGTREICMDYATRYKNIIRLFLRHEQDKIYVNGRKTGKYNSIQTRNAARGYFMCSLEGDDYWLSGNKLQRQYDLMVARPDVKLCGGITVNRYHDNSGALSSFQRSKTPNLPFEFDWFDFIKTSSLPIKTSTVFYRKDERIIRPWMYEIVNGDYTLAASLLENGGVGVVLDEIMSVYRRSDRGTFSTLTKGQRAGINCKTLWLYYNNCDPGKREFVLERYLEMAWLYLRTTRLKGNREYPVKQAYQHIYEHRKRFARLTGNRLSAYIKRKLNLKSL